MDYTDVSTVISMLPVPLIENKPGLQPSQFIIKAASNPLTDIEVLHVSRAKFPVYIDEHRPALIVAEPSDRVAAAICRDYKISVSHYEPNISEPGLFWVKDQHEKVDILSGLDSRIAGELERARTMQLEWFKRIVARADDDWGKYKMRRMISDMDRLASVALGLEREWNIDTMIERALQVCKFCRSQVNAEAMICPQCHGILDIEKARKDFKTIEQLTG